VSTPAVSVSYEFQMSKAPLRLAVSHKRGIPDRRKFRRGTLLCAASKLRCIGKTQVLHLLDGLGFGFLGGGWGVGGLGVVGWGGWVLGVRV